MNSLTQSRPDVYKTKAIITRKRRAAADKRLTVQFTERRQAFEAKLDAILAGNAEKWKSAIVDDIDAIPDNPADIFTPEEVGRFDFDEGRDCQPTEHYSKLGDIEAYIISWKQAKGELEMTAEYEDYLTDVEWMRTGCS